MTRRSLGFFHEGEKDKETNAITLPFIDLTILEASFHQGKWQARTKKCQRTTEKLVQLLWCLHEIE